MRLFAYKGIWNNGGVNEKSEQCSLQKERASGVQLKYIASTIQNYWHAIQIEKE